LRDLGSNAADDAIGAHQPRRRNGLEQMLRDDRVNGRNDGDVESSCAGRHSGYHSARGWTPESTPEEQAAADREVERAIGIVVLMAIAAVLGWWLAQ